MAAAPVWLILVHHLPTRPTRLRVRVWRQLQRLGALPVKNSVYVLPLSDRSLEDFTWLRQEIESAGGEAVLFRAGVVGGVTDDELIASFRKQHDAAWARLASDLDALGRRLTTRKRGATALRPDLDALDKEMDAMQTRFDALDQTDFFSAKGRSRAASALARLRGLTRPERGTAARAPGGAGAAARGQGAGRYQGKLWVTRPRPHIDRCASAWLIRRFIDRRPRFAFAAEGAKLRGGIPFDMAGAEFSHHGEDCTFETLVKRFGLGHDPALTAISRIVHDVDLKDGKFGRTEATGVNAVLRGLADRIRDDHELLRASEAVFDGLYATLGAQPTGGRKRAPRRGK